MFFVCSSVCGELGCSPVLAIVDSAALNIEVHVSFQIIVLSRYMPRSKIAGSYDNSSFFEEPPWYFQLWLHRFRFPTTV